MLVESITAACAIITHTAIVVIVIIVGAIRYMHVTWMPLIIAVIAINTAVRAVAVTRVLTVIVAVIITIMVVSTIHCRLMSRYLRI